MNENTSHTIIMSVIVLLIAFALYLDYKKDYIAMENGYVQKVVNNKKIWVKANCKEINNSKKD